MSFQHLFPRNTLIHCFSWIAPDDYESWPHEKKVDLIKEGVRNIGMAFLMHFRNLSNEIQLWAVALNEAAIDWIDVPTEEALKLDHTMYHHEVNCCTIGRREIWLGIVMKMELPEMYNLPDELKVSIVNFIAQ